MVIMKINNKEKFTKVSQRLIEKLPKSYLYCIGKNGYPKRVTSFTDWADEKAKNNWFQRSERMKNGKSEIIVSTVFLGIDHSFGMSKRPILYEIAIFNGSKRPTEIYRSYSKRDALKAHRAFVKNYKKLGFKKV